MRAIALGFILAASLAGVCYTPVRSATATEQAVPADWVQLHAGKAFSFYAPPGTAAVPVQGIDSFVGSFQSGNLDIGFDYGQWSNTLADFEGDPRFTTEAETIDGRPARVISGSGLGDETWGCEGYVTALYVVDRHEGPARIALTMYVCAKDAKDAQVTRQIVRTVRFQ